MNRVIAFSLLWLLPLVTLAQLDVKVETSKALVGMDSAKVVGTPPIILFEGKYREIDVAFINVETEASIIQIDAEDANRNVFEPKPHTAKSWYIDRPGKYWVFVTVVDFQKQIFAKKRFEVEVKGSSTNPNPDPDPNPNPTPDPNKFWVTWFAANPPPLELKPLFKTLAENFKKTASMDFETPQQLSTYLRDLNRKTLGDNNWQKMLPFSQKLSAKMTEMGIDSVAKAKEVLLQIAEGFETL